MLVEFRKVLARQEFYVVLLLSTAIAVLGLVGIVNANYLLRSDHYPTAFQAALVMGGDIGELYPIFLLPLLVVLPYADNYLLERKSGVHITCLTRQSRFRYFANKAFVVWISAVALVFFSYFLNQLLCLIAFPVGHVSNMDRSGYDIYSLGVFRETATNPTMLLHLNHPLLRNILHTLYACYYGGGIALLAYMLTLYLNMNRALANVLPVLVFSALAYAGIMIFGANGVLPCGIIYGVSYRITSYLPMIVAIAAIYCTSVVGILVKSYRSVDIL
jgi:hypothetical protein